MKRTSFRPIQAASRPSKSKRGDDRLLHIDSFRATPNHGKRLLRIFTNLNPYDKPRTWRLGEDFSEIARRFFVQPPPWQGIVNQLSGAFRITRSTPSLYDSIMLKIHDNMKLDDDYQNEEDKQRVDLASGSSWIVFTDQVPHAVLAGQYLLEQTFYLPVESMQDPHKSPLKILEKMTAKALV